MQGRSKFLIGGVILLAAVAYLIASNLFSQQQYFITVDALAKDQARYAGRSVRISGVVLGDTIKYDGHTLEFVIANVPDSIQEIKTDGGLADVLHQSALDPNAAKVTVILTDQPKPDLLKNEAQAIVTGTLGADGKFYADELLLKCPTRYQQDVPNQAGG
jgi:cytochrome c-type biogenesis protein CcmE